MPPRELAWLARGTPRQRAAWRALVESAVLERLAPWDAVLAGTFPIDLDIEGSDLDVLVCASDLDDFETFVRAAYGDLPRFRAHRRSAGPEAAVVAFEVGDVPIEVFAQGIPVRQQVAYRHLVVERRLLARGGEALRTRVRERKRRGPKRRGLSTEAAFAEILGLRGDPFRALLDLEREGDDALGRLLVSAGVVSLP